MSVLLETAGVIAAVRRLYIKLEFCDVSDRNDFSGTLTSRAFQNYIKKNGRVTRKKKAPQKESSLSITKAES